ncbi:hypothetical protein BJ912DRAFT_94991 [Pholiota molesta]|nr:hypothetical protein BJ912DRAFT_94991 [Pholiota molesta]
MSPLSNNCCHWCKENDSDLPPISHLPSPTPEQARKIADLDANIQCTDDDIQALIKRRATLGRKRNALVPAVNLPPEVLAMIFEFACYPIIVSEYGNRMVSQFDRPFQPSSTLKQLDCECTITPTLIGAVCSAWRNIAMETSQLWSNTKITFNKANSEVQAAKLRYWISKSGQRPLNLSLVQRLDDVDDEGSGVWSTAIFDILEDYAHRLQTLELVLLDAWDFNPDIAHRLPMLTRVSLHPRSGPEGMQDFDLFVYAPKLCDVTLYDCSITTALLPWAQLERLEVTSNSDGAVDCLSSLHLCPRLRSYMTHMGRYNSDVAPAITPITHATLEVLDVMDHSMTQAGINAFLGALTLPMLRSFSLYVYAEDPLTGVPALLPFLSRSAGKLETLCLAGQMPLEEQLWECLQVLPQLRKLVLDNGSYENTVLTQRTLDRMNPTKYGAADEEGARVCLAPNLETFYYHGQIDPTPHALVEFLADRWHGPSAVRTSGGHDVDIQPSIGLEARMARERLPSSVNAPLVRRLRSVAFTTTDRCYFDEPEIQFDDADTAVLRRLQQEGMRMVF